MSDVIKRCACDETKWTKCGGHAWYMSPFRFGGQLFRDSVTEWALVVLNETITTRTDADRVAEIMRTRIRAGTFVKAKAARAIPVKVDADLTLTGLVDAFDRNELTSTTGTDAADLDDGDEDETSDDTVAAHRARLNALCGFNGYGDRPARECNADALVTFRRSRALKKITRSTWAKYYGIYNRLFAEGVRLGVVTVNPFDAATKSQRKWLRRRKQKPRTRRLFPGELEKLVAGALQGRRRFDAQKLADLIVAAVECGGRQGELGAIQWADVVDPGDPTRLGDVVRITAVEDGAAKTGDPRTVPLSDDLRVVLERRWLNRLTGQLYPLDAYVFGDVTGARVVFPRRSWEGAIVRSTGNTVTQVKGNLSPESRAVYRGQRLHFHDVRRECASRWYASRVFDLLTIRDLLGHTSIRTTEVYLGLTPGTTTGLSSMRAFDAQRAAERAAASALPVAVGGSTDHNAITTGGTDPSTPSGPRLVKGRKAGVSR